MSHHLLIELVLKQNFIRVDVFEIFLFVINYSIDNVIKRFKSYQWPRFAIQFTDRLNISKLLSKIKLKEEFQVREIQIKSEGSEVKNFGGVEGFQF